VIIQGVSEFADRMPQCFLACVIGTPYLVEQCFSRDQLSRRTGKTQQDFPGLGRQVSGIHAIGDLAFKRLNQELTEIEALQEIGVHNVSSSHDAQHTIRDFCRVG